MKVVILCGGEGTRLKELTEEIPKALVEINGKPVLWHLMKIYSHYGFNEFILCLGYKGELIKKYFLEDHKWQNMDFSLNLGKENRLERHSVNEDWKITFVDTGIGTSKSDRLKQIRKFLDGDFFVAYGDDLCDVNITDLLEFHKRSRKIATLVSYNKIALPYGVVELDDEGSVKEFKEKPPVGKWINGGFYVFTQEIFDHLDKGELEKEVLEKLASLEQVGAYKHEGNWKSMTTLGDTLALNELWKNNKAWWKIWK